MSDGRSDFELIALLTPICSVFAMYGLYRVRMFISRRPDSWLRRLLLLDLWRE